MSVESTTTKGMGMLTLIVGTSNSGKSELAESLVMEMAGNRKKHYIATMIPFGEEGALRVEKHRKMREGKGFETHEWPTDIDRHLESAAGDKINRDSVVLLECMSNLVGNEMYKEEYSLLEAEQLVSRITEEIIFLKRSVEEAVIVTNEFPTADAGYDEETLRYVKATSAVNKELFKIADCIYELIDGAWIKHENC